MNLLNKAIIASCILGMSATVMARPRTCAEEQQVIERELAYARQHNNTNRINGLNRALANSKQYCSDAKRKTDHQEKIRQKEADIKEAELDLQEARAKGSAKKILKAENKVAEKKHKLKQLQDESSIFN